MKPLWIAVLLCAAIVPLAESGSAQPIPAPTATPSPLPSDVPYPAYGSPAPDVEQLVPITGIPSALTLTQAIDIAVMRAPSFAIDRAEYDAIRAKYSAEQQALFPYISATGSVTRNFGGFNNTTPVATASPAVTTGSNFGGRTTNEQASISAQQLIFDGGRAIAAIKSAKFGDLAGRATLLRDLQTLADTIATDYYAVLQDKATVTSDAQLVREFQVTEDSVRAEIRAGTAAQSDLAAAQFQTERARSQLVTAQGAAIIAQSAFAAAIGIDANAQAVPRQITTPANFESLPIYDKALAQALLMRPDYQSAQYNVTSAFQNVRYAKLARIPTVTANANDGVSRELPEEPSFIHSSSIGAVISVPIYDQGETNYNIAVAVSQLDQANATLTQTKLQVESDVRSGLAGAISARASYAQAQLEVRSAQVALNADEAKYKVGVSTILNIVTDEANLAQAETDYNTALYGTQTAEQTYLYALGINELHL